MKQSRHRKPRQKVSNAKVITKSSLEAAYDPAKQELRTSTRQFNEVTGQLDRFRYLLENHSALYGVKAQRLKELNAEIGGIVKRFNNRSAASLLRFHSQLAERRKERDGLVQQLSEIPSKDVLQDQTSLLEKKLADTDQLVFAHNKNVVKTKAAVAAEREMAKRRLVLCKSYYGGSFMG